MNFIYYLFVFYWLIYIFFACMDVSDLRLPVSVVWCLWCLYLVLLQIVLLLLFVLFCSYQIVEIFLFWMYIAAAVKFFCFFFYLTIFFGNFGKLCFLVSENVVSSFVIYFCSYCPWSLILYFAEYQTMEKYGICWEVCSLLSLFSIFYKFQLL